MLAKNLKITNKFEIAKINQRGRIVRSPLGLIKFLPAQEPQFVLSMSKKQTKKAVLRNRARRRMSSLIMQTQDNLPKIKAIIYLNQNVNEYSWQKLSHEWSRCLKNWQS